MTAAERTRRKDLIRVLSAAGFNTAWSAEALEDFCKMVTAHLVRNHDLSPTASAETTVAVIRRLTPDETKRMRFVCCADLLNAF